MIDLQRILRAEAPLTLGGVAAGFLPWLIADLARAAKGRAMFIYFSTGGDRWWNALFNVRFDRLFRPIR